MLYLCHMLQVGGLSLHCLSNGGKSTETGSESTTGFESKRAKARLEMMSMKSKEKITREQVGLMTGHTFLQWVHVILD